LSAIGSPLIDIKQIGKRYSNGFEALRGVSLHIDAGEMVFLSGHSGAGKSTLLRLIAGIEKPSNGAIHISGQDVARLKPAAAMTLRRSLGLIFQDHKLLFNRSVFDNVALPLLIDGYPDHDLGRRARAALNKVGLLDREKQFPVMLSGGEQQRLCIARAIVHRPSLVLADEPTGNLDEGSARDILAMFRSFNQVGVTIVIATHDRTLLESKIARIVQLDHGRLGAVAES
jgi:cell division transport system ATP-binding protein